MAQEPKREWYWPLGAIDYAHEIRDSFPTEAELIGVITILWNRQEIALGRLFITALWSSSKQYAEAIWKRQPTHQARRDLLALALKSAELTERQNGVLKWVIDRTKTVADRRNELIHAEYVVSGDTGALHAKVKSPHSTKPAKHQRVMESDLLKIANDVSELLQGTEAAQYELLSPEDRAQWDATLQDIKSSQLPRKSLQSS